MSTRQSLRLTVGAEVVAEDEAALVAEAAEDEGVPVTVVAEAEIDISSYCRRKHSGQTLLEFP